MNFEITKAMVTSGPLYTHFANIVLVGRVRGKDDSFVVYGCLKRDEKSFYKAVLGLDGEWGEIGFDTVEDVETWWLDGGDGLFMTIDKGSYKAVD